jgi:hypothetical protein
VSHLRILDPACGSGSFLIGAYQFLLDWHRDEYINDGPENWSKGKTPRIYQSQKGEWRLTTDERKRILLNNIYGVDIDHQAVEVTKLSMLLKVLEGEDEQSIGKQMLLFQERVLPDLSNNIKCGNSLIGPDFYSHQQTSLFDEEEIYRVNAFDWNAEFAEIMKEGGFDAVIGNPPWGANIHDSTKKYLASCYSRVVDRMVDTYIYFIDKALRISRSKGGLGLVIPATLLNQADTRSVRRLLATQGISAIVNLGSGVFGREATNTTIAIVVWRDIEPASIYLNDLKAIELSSRPQEISKGKTISFSTWKGLVNQDPLSTFFVSAIQDVDVLLKLQGKFPPLQSIIEGKIQRGVTPDCAEMHLVAGSPSHPIEPELIRKSISGDRIKRFVLPQSNCHIIYTNKQTELKLYPNAKT